jgi:hypothetical protein
MPAKETWQGLQYAVTGFFGSPRSRPPYTLAAGTDCLATSTTPHSILVIMKAGLDR